MEPLEDVEEFIPPFRAVFSPHDNPNLHTDIELKKQALKHAAAGTCKEHIFSYDLFIRPTDSIKQT